MGGGGKRPPRIFRADLEVDGAEGVLDTPLCVPNVVPSVSMMTSTRFRKLENN